MGPRESALRAFRFPGDAELDEFVRQHAETAFYPSCSCKMGEDEIAMVNGQGSLIVNRITNPASEQAKREPSAGHHGLWRNSRRKAALPSRCL